MDKDGSITYSKMAFVCTVAERMIILSPDPAREQVTVELQNVADGNMTLRMVDNVGKAVYTEVVTLPAGGIVVVIPVANLAKES